MRSASSGARSSSTTCGRSREGDRIALVTRTVASTVRELLHGIELDEPVRFLFGAGQVGVDAQGRIGEGIEEQATLVSWRNIETVLGDADMHRSHQQFGRCCCCTRRLRAARGKARCSMSIGRVDPHLRERSANPQWLIEIDFFVAAAPR